MSFFLKNNGSCTLNDIAEFTTIEDKYTMGMLTKAGQLRAHVKRFITKAFNQKCWIEIEEPDYSGHE